MTDVVIDSRLAIPGCLFVAYQGDVRHGHEFVAAAFGAGAVAAIVEDDLALDCQHVDLRRRLDPAPATLELPLCLRVESSLHGTADARSVLAQSAQSACYWHHGKRGQDHDQRAGGGGIGATLQHVAQPRQLQQRDRFAADTAADHQRPRARGSGDGDVRCGRDR